MQGGGVTIARNLFVSTSIEDYNSQTFQQVIPAADSQNHQHQIEAHFISS